MSEQEERENEEAEPEQSGEQTEGSVNRAYVTESEESAVKTVGATSTNMAHEESGVKSSGGATRLRYQIIASLVATFGGMVVGLGLGYSSPANPDLETYIIHTTSAQNSLIGSMMPLGALFGGLAAGWLMDQLGRRTAMLLITLPFLAGWLMITYAGQFGVILAGRLITGFATGCTTVTVPTFVGEICEARIRGAMGASFQFQITLGILLCYIIGKYAHWNYLAMACTCFPVVWVVLVCLVCESPLWLIDKGRELEAHDTLMWLRGPRADVNAELAQLRANNEQMRANQASFRDLRRRENLRPLLMSLVIMLGQQLSGINAVVFYTTDIFKDAGSSIDSSVATIIVGVVQMASTFAAVVLVDRLGRKLLLIASAAIMCVCLVVLGVYFYLSKTVHHDVSNIGWLPLVCLMLYIFAFSIGFGPIPWLMMGELFAPEVKGLASSCAAAFNWLLAFAVVEAFDGMLNGLTEAGTFWLFAAICALIAAYVYFFAYETKGKALEQIQEHFK